MIMALLILFGLFLGLVFLLALVGVLVCRHVDRNPNANPQDFRKGYDD